MFMSLPRTENRACRYALLYFFDSRNDACLQAGLSTAALHKYNLMASTFPKYDKVRIQRNKQNEKRYKNMKMIRNTIRYKDFTE
jgi:hypothetical protein